MGLWREGDGVIHRVQDKSTLWKLLDRAINAYEARTQILQQQSIEIGLIGNRLELIHGIVFELQQFNGKVEEFMATQEERLKNVQTALQGVADGVNTLQQQIADLKTNNPDLEDEISAIEGTVKAIADDINGVVTPPEPTT